MLDAVAHTETTSEQTIRSEYTDLLDQYGVSYVSRVSHLHIGQPAATRGWLIHLSVIMSQADDLLEQALPLLIAKGHPFKIPSSFAVVRYILEGVLGNDQIGKIITVYPPSDRDALDFVRAVLPLTTSFTGPAVLTDCHIAGIVYTRYGAFDPIIVLDAAGLNQKHFYDRNGQLVQDYCPIPFERPDGVHWPFSAISPGTLPREPKILNHIYKTLKTLKSDVRGNVYTGIYIKSLLSIKRCVIKQGKKNMSSDLYGRDMRERLAWQAQMHRSLAGLIPVPQIYDLFIENGDNYMVIEHIPGCSLYERLLELNYNFQSWANLAPGVRSTILEYLSSILSAVQRLHDTGYVHRDLAPGNFMLDDQDRVRLIDIELMFSLRDAQPDPPFDLGTPGFMSPEQLAIITPTTKEDIYGLGGLMIVLFTGLSPLRFDVSDPTRLQKNLNYFIADDKLTALVTSCLSLEPSARPDVVDIIQGVDEYRRSLRVEKNQHPTPPPHPVPTNHMIAAAITGALTALTKPPIPLLDDIWYSKILRDSGQHGTGPKEFKRYPGMHTGLSGVLYTVAAAKYAGYDTGNALDSYYASWSYLKESILSNSQNVPPGLYHGTAGVALAIARGIRSGLLEDNEQNREYIQHCFAQKPSTNDLSDGLAGVGIALLRCAKYLTPAFLKDQFSQIVPVLVNNQSGYRRNSQTMAFETGSSGLIWFLLEYASIYQDSTAENAAIKTLDWLLRQTNDLKDLYERKKYRRLQKAGQEPGNIRTGLILALLKAYETAKCEKYRQVCESSLAKYPDFVVNTNLTQESGLLGLGEIYLEAARVTKNQMWQARASWITEALCHLSYKGAEEEEYWLFDESVSCTADLMIGHCGVLHFLMRYQSPEKIHYRLLS